MGDGAAKTPHWACKASAQCGFNHNYATRTHCLKCGRDKTGRLPPPDVPSKRVSGEPRQRRSKWQDGPPGEIAKLKAEIARLKKNGATEAEESVDSEKDELNAIVEVHAFLENPLGKDHPDTLVYAKKVATEKRHKQDARPLPARLQIANRELERRSKAVETAQKAEQDAADKLEKAKATLLDAKSAKAEAESKLQAVQNEIASEAAARPGQAVNFQALLPTGTVLTTELADKVRAFETQWAEFVVAIRPAPASPGGEVAADASEEMETDDLESEIAATLGSLNASASPTDFEAAKRAAAKRIADAQREQIAKRRLIGKAPPTIPPASNAPPPQGRGANESTTGRG